MAFSSKLIHRITKTTSADVMHSSGYAKYQNNGSFGTASNESFSQRQAIDKNRQIIQNYSHSQIGQQRGVARHALTAQEKDNMSASIPPSTATTPNNTNSAHANEGSNRLDMTSRLNQRFESYGQNNHNTRQAFQTSSVNHSSYGRVSAAQSRQIRQERAQRFSGNGGNLGRVDQPSNRFNRTNSNNVATPTPKTGGFQGNFGRH